MSKKMKKLESLEDKMEEISHKLNLAHDTMRNLYNSVGEGKRELVQKTKAWELERK